MKDWVSRERLRAALSCAQPDHVPCCFMAFQALQKKCVNDFEFFDRQLALGIDTRVQLPDLPMRFSVEVTTQTWKEQSADDPVPRLHKQYRTPSGTLETVVKQTDDWEHSDQIPLLDDFLAPRATQFLIRALDDLPALRHLLIPPTAEDIAAFRETAREYKHYADVKGLMFSGGWRDWRSNPVSIVGNQGGTMLGIDALMWLCGATAPLFWAIDDPAFLEELIAMVAMWDEQRLKIYLDVGAELIVARAWYAGTEFWSPRLYRRFIAPIVRRQVALTHQAGAKFGYIMTSGMMSLVDDLLDLGIDAIIGVDPAQGKGTNLDELARQAGGRLCIWGGVSAPMSIEHASRAEIWKAVERALATRGAQGGLILSPVDNILDLSQETWQNVLEFIKAWQHLRK